LIARSPAAASARQPRSQQATAVLVSLVVVSALRPAPIRTFAQPIGRWTVAIRPTQRQQPLRASRRTDARKQGGLQPIHQVESTGATSSENSRSLLFFGRYEAIHPAFAIHSEEPIFLWLFQFAQLAYFRRGDSLFCKQRAASIQLLRSTLLASFC